MNKENNENKENKENEKEKVKTILKRYPDKVPVIVKKEPRSSVQEIDRKKFLVPIDLSFAQFIHVIRKRVQMTPEKAIFVYAGNHLVSSSLTMQEVYEMYKDKKDDLLYVTYASENTFG